MRCGTPRAPGSRATSARRTGPGVRRHGLRALPVALALIALGACTAPERQSRVAVSLIGIDGAAWRVIDPLLRDGELPTFARLIRDGVRAPLRSELPLASAAIWTTIATGVPRQAHGIPEFLKDGRLISSSDRRAAALWNLASEAGLRSCVLAWWATFPAEPIDGVMITERAFKSREGDLTPFVRRDLGTPVEARLAWPAEALDTLPEPTSAAEPANAELPEHEAVARRMRSEDTAIVDSALRARERFGPFELELILLRGIDPVSHFFWKFHEPDAAAYRPRERPTPEQVEKYGEQIRDHYRLVDGLLARLLAGSESERVVLLVSDHGFEAGRQPFRTGAVLSGTHKTPAALDGILIASGGPVRPGARVEAASIYDLAPTLAYLLGLPLSEELPGRVLTELFEPAFARGREPERVARYEFEPPEAARDPAGTASPGEAQLLEELRALGYIE